MSDVLPVTGNALTPTEIIAAVLEAHVGRIGTHYEGCWKYHAACLAMLLRKAGVDAPPKNEGEDDG